MLVEMTSRRITAAVALLVTLAFSSPAAQAQSACQLSGGFAQLATQIPDRVGTCQGNVTSRPELGEATQPTSNGLLVYHTIDGVVSFSDGTRTWVLDPTGQAQVRDVNERFPFE